jgi:hypothetical protein
MDEGIDWRSILANHVQRAEDELMVRAAERSLCEVSQEQPSTDALSVKAAEGAWAALRDLVNSSNSTTVQQEIHLSLVRIDADLQQDRGPMWHAYSTGARRALVTLREQLDAAST